MLCGPERKSRRPWAGFTKILVFIRPLDKNYSQEETGKVGMPMKVWVGAHEHLKENELHEWRRHAELLNFEIVKNLKVADLAILKDLNPASFISLLLSRRKVPKVQFVSEPRIVWPLSYLPLLERFFDLRVFRCRTSSGMPAEKNVATSLWDPNRVLPKEKNSTPRGERMNRAVIVNAHKFSFIQGELYSLRRKCVDSDLPVDLFGELWKNKPRSAFLRALKALILAILTFQKLELDQLPLMINNSSRMNLGGAIDSKIECMEKYKIGLVIENSQELMTEKIWDSWNSGCIPVYVGPPLTEWDIPKDLYIQCSPDLGSIKKGIMMAMHMDHQDFLRKLDKWIHSRKCRDKFGYEKTVELLYGVIEEQLKIRF